MVAVVEFRRGTQTPIYQVEHWAFGELLPKRRRVQVLYDPSNPGGCAQVGFADGDLLVYTILGVLLVGLPIFIIIGILTPLLPG
ncbi:hypothetical protein KSD_43520 [Ktedonobacter sp. SOSP1-85]|uniref:hypothetical protein n=1 Tax=Ktedonobacter sp. SOSP1-85 TaxID=2778367 RepID=UPI0019162094|nr:hypothetical protein [Ktedonobacter sp. SOSP1-85]GHO76581.1 hypothetical protein KSD_43520 [Ktedonobacter sp. SOSP1-85]